jgi:hypothetical protein
MGGYLILKMLQDKIKAMLNLGSKILLFLSVVVVFSCTERIQQTKEITFRNKSLASAQAEYQVVHFNAIDSISKYYIENKGESEYILDSLICFNKEGTKFIGALLARCLVSDAVMDNLHFFYGLKINKLWYFFSGATIVLPREVYSQDVHTPLTFTKLHEIAMQEIFAGYLTPEGEINEKFFSVFKKDAYNYPFTTQEAWEASYLKLINENWKKRDTTPNKVLP